MTLFGSITFSVSVKYLSVNVGELNWIHRENN